MAAARRTRHCRPISGERCSRVPADAQPRPKRNRQQDHDRPFRHARQQQQRGQQHATISGMRGSDESCSNISVLSSRSAEERVTMIPVAVEMIRAGNCVAMPSPMVSRVKCCRASFQPMPICATPMIQPGDDVDQQDHDAGDGVALDELARAVHGAVEGSLPFRAPARRRMACFWSIRPMLRSASMLICWPGMESSVKRAATSDTRWAPLVTTTYCTTTRMKNTTRPTTKLPLHREGADGADHLAGIAIRSESAASPRY